MALYIKMPLKQIANNTSIITIGVFGKRSFMLAKLIFIFTFHGTVSLCGTGPKNQPQLNTADNNICSHQPPPKA